VAAAADYFFTRPWLGTLVSVLLNAFPFAREGPVRPSLEWCGRLLDDGWSLVVFPEGTRSPDGEIAPFRPGIGLMALELDVPIVPVRLRGAHNAWPKGRALPRRGSVTIEFGRPLRFRHGTDYAHAIRILEAAVRAL
jgi:long-chain acyl-CoA synthetase